MRDADAILGNQSHSHSHSIVLSDDNALIYRRNIFRAWRRTVPSIRQKFALLNSKENFDDPRFARFRGLSASIGRFSVRTAKKPITALIAEKPSIPLLGTRGSGPMAKLRRNLLFVSGWKVEHAGGPVVIGQGIAVGQRRRLVAESRMAIRPDQWTQSAGPFVRLHLLAPIKTDNCLWVSSHRVQNSSFRPLRHKMIFESQRSIEIV